MKANDGQCLNLVSFIANNQSAVVLTLSDRTLVHRRYLPNDVGTHLQLRQIGGKLEIQFRKLLKRTMPNVGDKTLDPRVLNPTT